MANQNSDSGQQYICLLLCDVQPAEVWPSERYQSKRYQLEDCGELQLHLSRSDSFRKNMEEALVE